MTQSNILFIGMDVHKESIVISLADDDRSEVRRYGSIGGTMSDFKKTLRKLVSTGKSLFFCYKAGPCGYELYRFITSQGHQCIVVAPSLIPKKSGDKIKTDKRDADNLTRLLRSGDLTPVFVPNAEDEAMIYPDLHDFDLIFFSYFKTIYPLKVWFVFKVNVINMNPVVFLHPFNPDENKFY